MLVFVVPLKHPARSRDYRIVTDLLRQTLGSIERQRDPRFAAVVVCNQRPDWARDSDRLRFVEVGFPPPDPPARREDWVDWLYQDKGCKVAVGLAHAKAFDPTHVMFVDADDFVSNRLAGWVAEHPDAAGWYMPDGLIYSGLFKIAEPRDRFWSYCGTTHILRADLLPVPDFVTRTPTKDDVIAALDDFYVTRILGCHLDFEEYCTQQGATLEPLPFVGSLWHADTGENSSRAWWNQTRFGPIWGRPLTSAESEEFGVEASARRKAAVTLLLYGWRARSRVARALRRVGVLGGGGGKAQSAAR